MSKACRNFNSLALRFLEKTGSPYYQFNKQKKKEPTMPSSDSVDYKERKPYWDTINKRTGKPIMREDFEDLKGRDIRDYTTTTERKYLRPYLNDQIVVDVIERIKSRADKGMSKYGVPMTRGDVSTIEWLRHAQEEAMDLAVYLERCIQDLKDMENLRV